MIGGGPRSTAPSAARVTNGPRPTHHHLPVKRLTVGQEQSYTASPGLLQGGARVAVADVERDGFAGCDHGAGARDEGPRRLFDLQPAVTGAATGAIASHTFLSGALAGGGYKWGARALHGGAAVPLSPGPGRLARGPPLLGIPQGKLLSWFPSRSSRRRPEPQRGHGNLNAKRRGAGGMIVGTLAAPARVLRLV